MFIAPTYVMEFQKCPHFNLFITMQTSKEGKYITQTLWLDDFLIITYNR